jgi:serine/threonine protein kinase
VAIKFLPVSFSSDPDRLRRFQLEAEAAAALNHPNILSIFHIGQQDGAPYIVTELLEGETLRERLRHGALKLRDAIDIAIQTAKGLAAAHDKGIAHRDLKPENLFIAEDGRVKILDFGLAKLIQSPSSDGTTISPRDQTDAGRVLGTVGYMAPEQVRGEPADTRSDIFSLGCVLYEMLTGKRAFRKPTAAETMSAILNDDPPVVSEVTRNIPPALESVVHRCFEKAAGRRFQSASDLAFALKAFSDTASGTTQIKHSSSNKKKRVLLVVATALLGFGALAFVWWVRPPALPVVESVAQLSDDGQPKGVGSLVTDGSRIYFNEGIPGSKKIMQVSTAGGETSAITTRLTDPETIGIAPDGSSLMVFDGEGTENPAWLVPLPTGEPRRLGAVEGQAGDFFPDGRVVFIRAPDLSVAEKDGSNIRKLATAGDSSYCPQVSPDGRRIVFSAYAPQEQLLYLAQVAADGTGLHEIMRGSQEAQVTCAYWTPDGNYLVTRLGEDIWLVPMKKRAFQANREPIQLTNGPLTYSSLCPSRDGKRIFAIGTKRRVELVRYDRKSNQFVPFLSGISAIDPTFSRDGQWVAYVSYPDRTLWRSRADGTDRMQLTYLHMKVTYP